MAHTPLKITIQQTHAELDEAWTISYSPERTAQALDVISDHWLDYRLIHLVMRLFFRGIYFPQMNKRAWLKVLAQNRKAIFRLIKEGIGEWRGAREKRSVASASADMS